MSRIELGIDQWSATMQPRPKVDAKNGIYEEFNSEGWEWCCASLPWQIAEVLQIKEIFGCELNVKETGKTHGYSNGLSIANQDFAICWHSDFAYFTMGINIRFGAKTWHEYCEKYEKKYVVPPILPMLVKKLNLIHPTGFTRIDLTADFFDYTDISPDYINTEIDKKEIEVLSVKETAKELPDGTQKIIKTYRKAYRGKTAYVRDKKAETLYIGSLKSPVFAVLYDKRAESIKKHGYRYKDALACKSWMRMEVRFHGDFAHQISDDFLSWQPADNMAAYIAKRIDDKYHFSYTKKVDKIPFSEDLRKTALGCGYGTLSRPHPRDNDLERSRDYMIKYSGLFSWLYKIKKVYGADMDKKACYWLFDLYNKSFTNSFVDNPEVKNWLKKHLDSARQVPFTEIFPPDFQIDL